MSSILCFHSDFSAKHILSGHDDGSYMVLSVVALASAKQYHALLVKAQSHSDRVAIRLSVLEALARNLLHSPPTRCYPPSAKLAWKGKMEISEMAKGNGLRGGRDNGMESALWVMQGTAGTRRRACRRVPARTFSRLQLLCFIVFAAGTREKVGDTTCIVLVPCGPGGLSQ